MRRAAVAGMCVAALAAGCGGGPGRSSDRPAPEPASPGPAAAAAPQAADGRLGAAVVARPGDLRSVDAVRRITGRMALPPDRRSGVGAEANCADADVQPAPDNLAHVSDVVFCLMNAMRANAGVPALTRQEQLAQASLGHSQDMVDQKYFAHDSLDGRDLVARLEQAAYIPDSGDWVVGENLVWGAGSLATPKALVNAWMNSPAHRDNLLSGDFREVGMGVVFGTPDADHGDGVTVTTDFGTRRPAEPAGPADDGDAAVVARKRASGRRSRARRRAIARRRRAALRRCRHRHGKSRRRCVRAARRRR